MVISYLFLEMYVLRLSAMVLSISIIEHLPPDYYIAKLSPGLKPTCSLHTEIELHDLLALQLPC